MGARQSTAAPPAPGGNTTTPHPPPPGPTAAPSPGPPRTGLTSHPAGPSALVAPFPRPPPSPSFGGLRAYFSWQSSQPLEHAHHRPARMELVFLLRARGLPSHLIPRVLDEQEGWSVCWVKVRQLVSIIAGQRGPRDPRTVGPSAGVPQHWRNGQEVELGWDSGRGAGGGLPGLEEGDGKLWYLVSRPIGCAQNPLEETSDLDGDAGGGTTPTKETPDTPTEKDPDPPIGVQHGDEGVGEARARKGYIREVVIETVSRDQGWSSSEALYYGTYDQSYSWFEVSLLRDGEEVPNSREIIQHNVHAGQYVKTHKIVLDMEHPTVRLARPGDRFVLWARAMFPGWVNNVREASIAVYSYPYPTEL